MLPKKITYKSTEQFIKGAKQPPKSPQGKPNKKTKLSKAPKGGKKTKTGSQMLAKAMKSKSK